MKAASCAWCSSEMPPSKQVNGHSFIIPIIHVIVILYETFSSQAQSAADKKKMIYNGLIKVVQIPMDMIVHVKTY